MTLKKRYDEASEKPTPRVTSIHIQEVMAVIQKTEIMVGRWLSGEDVSDALTRSVLAKHFNCMFDTNFKTDQFNVIFDSCVNILV